MKGLQDSIDAARVSENRDMLQTANKNALAKLKQAQQNRKGTKKSKTISLSLSQVLLALYSVTDHVLGWGCCTTCNPSTFLSSGGIASWGVDAFNEVADCTVGAAAEH